MTRDYQEDASNVYKIAFTNKNRPVSSYSIRTENDEVRDKIQAYEHKTNYCQTKRRNFYADRSESVRNCGSAKASKLTENLVAYHAEAFFKPKKVEEDSEN
jgi:hypothetical protein